MNRGVEVRRFLRAAPERVFAAFADARTVARWLTPSPEISLTVLAFDFRVGGSYRFAYHVPGVLTPMVVGGAYSAIERPSRIVFSWLIEPPDEHAGIVSQVTVTITPETNGSRLVIQHERWTRPDAETRHAAGWEGALDRLVTLLSVNE